MQIKELIIYGHNGGVRRLPFNLGKVNIITGKSKSGKSAVGAIIDYCLGGNSCNVADGVVRDCADWYALLLQFDEEQAFVARKNPLPTQQTTSYCYVQVGKKIAVPGAVDFISNQNVAGLEEFLSRRVGISENMNVPPDGQSRQPLTANIRHALFYCFQNQDEIASPQNLFHKQQEDFVTQSIKDTLPYFLGVVNEESLALDQEKTRLKRQLVIEKRRLEENLSLQGGGLDRAISLISEAKEVGLLSQDSFVDYDNYDAVKGLLASVDTWSPDEFAPTGTDRLTTLQSELSVMESELEELNFEIEKAKNFAGAGIGYEGAARNQAMRLSSIGLFEQMDFRPNHCPFCSGEMGEKSNPTVDALKSALANLDAEINTIERERPQISKYLGELETSRHVLRDKIRSGRAEIDGIFAHNEKADIYRDLMARRARVAGRISLWIDSMNSVDNLPGKQATIVKLKSRIDEIESILSHDGLEERKMSALSRISVDMSRWAKQLELEHGDNPYRLDMSKVTVMVDRPERPIPLRQLGSGSNWVGVHLVTYLALHKHFIEANRPVPRFVFIDQPSQVYFPSETEEHGDQDWVLIRELYDFLFNRVAELHGSLQLIIVDHANLDNEPFKNAVVENWLKDENLIPTEWYIKN